jgi:hypothetical protein
LKYQVKMEKKLFGELGNEIQFNPGWHEEGLAGHRTVSGYGGNRGLCTTKAVPRALSNALETMLAGGWT